MLSYRSCGEVEVGVDDVAFYRRAKAREQTVRQDERVQVGWTFTSKMGRQTIFLEQIEFLILDFLAARPYRAYTPDRIAAAVSTMRQPVTPRTLGRYVASLRRKPGFFADFIQTVPHIGYRYKA